jgi:parvulin-like peptidyl-prolyl isomerase
MNRAVPKRRPPAPPQRPPLSRRHLSKQQRERRYRRIFFTSVGVLFALIVLIPLVGYYREVLTKGQQPVAHVEGQVVTLDEYAKAYALRLNRLEGNIAQMQMLAGQTTSNNSGANVFAQQLQRLQAERETLDQTVLTEVVDNRLIANEAAKRGITVSTEEENAELRKEFGDAPVPTPNPATPSPTVAPDATATPPPAPTIDPVERFRTQLASSKLMSEAEYRSIEVRPKLLREKLTAAIASDVTDHELEIHARHILVENEEAAKAAKARIDAGEPFEKVAAEVSSDTSNKDKGGDLDWFGRGRMTKPFEDVAFDLPVGKVSDPVQSSFGWHLIQVLERDENHPLAPDEVASKRDAKFGEWLNKAKDDGFQSQAISYNLSPDQIAWAKSRYSRTQA